jgi:hypothetical protein
VNYLPSLIVIFALIGCSTVATDQPDRINVFPRDTDPQVRTFVEREFLQIIAVTESPAWRPTVTLEHIGRGWVGATYGPWDIRIETGLVQTAMTNEAALWALRRTIAHEIGHAMSGHRFTTTARQQGNELEADAKGIEYFKRLGWSCKLWVDNFARGLKRGYNIDAEHDSKARYDQAQQLCPQSEGIPVPKSQGL